MENFLRDDYWFFSTSDQLAFGVVETQPAKKATQKSSRIEIYKSQCKQQWEKAVTHRKTKGPGEQKRKKQQGVGGGGAKGIKDRGAAARGYEEAKRIREANKKKKEERTKKVPKQQKQAKKAKAALKVTF